MLGASTYPAPSPDIVAAGERHPPDVEAGTTARRVWRIDARWLGAGARLAQPQCCGRSHMLTLYLMKAG